MTIEITILISVLSVSFAIYSGITNMKRNAKSDTQKETSDMTTVIVELKYISNGVTEIKHELVSVKEDIQSLRDKTTSHSECIKQIIDRVTDIERKVEKYHEH